MQLSTGQEAVNNTGLASNELTMQHSASAFEIVFSSLYERKEEAVLRELACNALDAHIVAGIPNVPIHIKLPTTLNPNLVVTDQGDGMSLSTVNKVYFAMFASTKRDNNNEIGGYGIGSKSPYAITESFTVKTIHKGLRTDIIMSLDKGIPKSLIVASEVPTDEPNGTTVTVPVSCSYKQSKLTLVAEKLFTYWDTLPECSEVTLNSKTKTKLFSTNHFTYTSLGFRTIGSIFGYILVGPVKYAVPDEIMNSLKFPKTMNSSRLRDLLGNAVRVLLTSEIGKVKIAPSRERIDVTTENKDYIQSLVDEVTSSLEEDFRVSSLDVHEIIYKHVKDVPPSENGLSYNQIAALQTELHSKHLESTLHRLCVETPEALSKTKRDYLIAFSDATYYASCYQNNKIPEVFVLSLNAGYMHRLNSLGSLKRFTNDQSSIIRRYTRLKLNAEDKVTILVEAESLTNQQKSLITYNRRLAYTSGDSSTFLELYSCEDIDLYKQLAKDYLPYEVEFLTFKELSKTLVAKPKVSRSTSGTNKPRGTPSIESWSTHEGCANKNLTPEDVYSDTEGVRTIFIVEVKPSDVHHIVRNISDLVSKIPTRIVYITATEKHTARYKNHNLKNFTTCSSTSLSTKKLQWVIGKNYKLLKALATTWKQSWAFDKANLSTSYAKVEEAYGLGEVSWEFRSTFNRRPDTYLIHEIFGDGNYKQIEIAHAIVSSNKQAVAIANLYSKTTVSKVLNKLLNHAKEEE
jgi:hypothetical protein